MKMPHYFMYLPWMRIEIGMEQKRLTKIIRRRIVLQRNAYFSHKKSGGNRSSQKKSYVWHWGIQNRETQRLLAVARLVQRRSWNRGRMSSESRKCGVGTPFNYLYFRWSSLVQRFWGIHDGLVKEKIKTYAECTDDIASLFRAGISAVISRYIICNPCFCIIERRVEQWKQKKFHT